MSNQKTLNETKDQKSENNSEKSLLAKNSKLLSAAIGVAVIAVGIFAFNYFIVQPKEEKAQTNLAMGVVYVEQANEMLERSLQIEQEYNKLLSTGDTLKVDSVKKALDASKKEAEDTFNKALNGDGKYPGFLKISQESFTSAANIATANAGICYFNLGKYDESIKYLSEFSPKGDKGLSAQYIAALANSYASTGKAEDLDKAVDAFKEAANIAGNDVLSPSYLLEAGKILEHQGKKEEALSIYMSVKEKYPTSAIANSNPNEAVENNSAIDKYIERVSK